jgi:NTP pyrophosphatase (non-canonical NTP hydrolase)
MTPSKYLEESARTDNTPRFIQLPLTSDGERQFVAELMHASMGMVTEAGEFIDALKKHTIYGKPIDRVNLVEEIGDLFWYQALACRALGVSFEEVMERNIAKLRKRFPEKFTAELALSRDLDAERAALEGKP